MINLPLSYFIPFKVLVVLLFCSMAEVLTGQVEQEDPCEDSIRFGKVDIIYKSVEENSAIIEKKLKFFKEFSDWECYVHSLNDKSYLFYFKGEYLNLIEHSKLVLDQASEMLSENSPARINAMLMRAIAVELAGDYKKAIDLQNKSARLSTDPSNKLRAYENNGISYEELGDYDEAIRSFGYALSLLNEISDFDPHLKGRVIKQIAFCHKEKGGYRESLKLYRQSLDILHSLPPKPYYRQTLWFAYQEIADLYLKINQLDSAMHYSVKAISIQQKAKNLIKSYLTYTSHGEIWLAKKDYKRAVESFDKALALAEKEYKDFNKHPSFAICLNKKAEAYLKKGDCQLSLKYSQEALQKIAVNFNSDIYSENPSSDQYIVKQNGLDILSTKSGALLGLFGKEGNQAYLQSAHETFSFANQLIQSIRQDYLAEGSKHTLSEKALPIYERSIETALKLYEISGENQYLESAFSAAEANKSTVLYESIKNNMAKGSSKIPDSFLERENELLVNRNFNQKLIREEQQKKEGADMEKIKASEKLVFELNAELEKLVEEMEKNYPDYLEQKKQTNPASFETARKNLTDNKASLVEFMIGEKNAYIFLLTKNDLQLFKIKEKEKLEERVRRLRELITTPPSSRNFDSEFQEFTNLSYLLYSQILKEGIENLSKGINRLVIIPDDLLCYLPFEILIREKPKNEGSNYSPKSLAYLMEDYQIGYQYSASLMTAGKKNKSEVANIGNFVGFAPTFDGGHAETRTCSADKLYSLLCNEQEVTTISGLMDGAAYVAAGAGLEGFNQHAANYRILHLATHACVDDSGNGLNKIYLADGDLSQYELNNLRLNAELTVLSACNTGMGQLLKGEGMMSLTRSFMLAGSQSVLTSLWSVDDCATSDIMVEYYKCLKKGLPKDEALIQAKLAYLTTADRNNSHPYYWAAFVQFGDIQPIDFSFSFKWYYLFGAFILSLALIYIFWKNKNI